VIIYGIPTQRNLRLENVFEKVKEIINYVRGRGDEALIELTKKFDKVSIDSVVLDTDQLKRCCRDLDQAITKSINKVFSFLWRFHEKTLPRNMVFEIDGVILGYIWRSVESVGVYVPGGRKSYPSSLMMCGIPAKVAGVEKLYVASPPLLNGCVNPAVAYISLELGVEEVYRVGGAQAIAALAYGTETVKKVAKIVGPGNIYVQAAKFLVQDVVSIDGVEGPTELVVVADESADPHLVALDMMSQAEHGVEALVVLLTTSSNLANKVSQILGNDKDHVYYIATVKSIDEAIELVNKLAPEHLSLHISSYEKYIDKVVNVGAISIKNEAPALIDYIGPNHVLPTNSWAKSRGALSVYDFLKPISIVVNSSSIDRELLDSVISLARYEGFEIHSRSIGVRYGYRHGD
jgi:histidinol dehydrogenase